MGNEQSPWLDGVVVTGLGAVSGCGWGVESLWQVLCSGHTAVDLPRRFDTSDQRTRLAAEAPPAPKEGQHRFEADAALTEADRFALFAAQEALDQAGIDASDVDLGVFFGGSTAGMAEAERYYGHLVDGADAAARLRLLSAHQINGPGDAVARHLGATGPVVTLSSACASGGLALGAALDALRDGEVEVALAGGSDSLCRLTYAGFNSLRAVDAEACKPFRGERQGLNLGEGAGVLVLETAEHAMRRGARVLGRVVGCGASCDAHHMTAPHPEGRGAAEAVRGALDDGRADPSQVEFVNAHGTGTPRNDIAEWHALETVFGDRAAALPVTSTKGAVGHLLGSSGAIESVATVLCLLHRAVHPTPGEGTVDEAMEVDLVQGTPRSIDGSGLAVSTSFAFGGSNAAVLFAGPEVGLAEESRS